PAIRASTVGAEFGLAKNAIRLAPAVMRCSVARYAVRRLSISTRAYFLRRGDGSRQRSKRTNGVWGRSREATIRWLGWFLWVLNSTGAKNTPATFLAIYCWHNCSAAASFSLSLETELPQSKE